MDRAAPTVRGRGRHHAPPCSGGSAGGPGRRPRAGTRGAAAPLERYAPVVVHASGEPSPLTSVKVIRRPRARVSSRARRGRSVYGRRDGPWLQYWMFFAENPQDRGLLRTGRHEGDWEMVQYRLRGGRPVRAVYAQHSGAESCGYGHVRRSRGRPVVFLARGSHAAYFVPGLRDRTWPDPNDEADGRGPRVRPRLVRVSEDRPPWMALPGPLGRDPRGLDPGRDGLAARPGVPAGALGRRRAGPRRRGRAPARTATSAASATGARRRWRRSLPPSGCSWRSASRGAADCAAGPTRRRAERRLAARRRALGRRARSAAPRTSVGRAPARAALTSTAPMLPASAR